MTARRSRLAAALSLSLLAASCGGSSPAETAGEELAGDIVAQGDVTLDEDTVVTTSTSAAPDDAAGGASEADPDGGGGLVDLIDDIPQEEESVEGEFFDSVGVFMSCMNVEIGGFRGIPDFGEEERDESLPRNEPAYIRALSDCAARSDIVNTMAAAEDSSRFSAEEIEDRNRGYVVFRDCLIGRGWTIPEPSPDENGLLFNSYQEAASDWKPPAGDSLLDSDDLQECGAQGNPLGIGGDGDAEGGEDEEDGDNE